MKIFIRADGSEVIGTGHIMRTLVLAEKLKESGREVIFLCRTLPGAPLSRIQKSGFKIETIANVWPFGMELVQVRSLIEKYCPKWIIVDHYEAKENYYHALKEFGIKVMAIDDINETKFPVDILFNQNINAKDLKYKHGLRTKRVLGPKYALVKDVYAQVRSAAKIRTELNSVLVFIGGADPDNQTLKVLRGIVRSGRTFKVDIVLGSAFKHSKSIEAEIRKHGTSWKVHRDLPDLAQLMLNADLAIGAGGSVSWEMCTLKLPMVLMPNADNQLGIAKGLAKARAAINLGKFDSVSESDVAKVLRNLSDKKLKELSRNAGRICDGLGAEREVYLLE